MQTTAARRAYRFILSTRTSTLMDFTKSRIDFKQRRDIRVGIDNFEEALKQTLRTPFAELVVNTVPIAVFFWKSPPLAPVFGYIQYRIEELNIGI